MNLFAAATLSLSAVAVISPAIGSGMKVLYSFCSQSGCTDGVEGNPLIMDETGNLYGTTQFGGMQNNGVVFKLSPGEHGHYNYQVLYNFCSQTNCVDGAVPFGSLVIDTSGNLYGANSQGGNSNGGDVFELVQTNGAWTLNVLYSFCSFTNCTDGGGARSGLTYSRAAAGMPYDGTSPLFGSTRFGGAHAYGAVYQLEPGKGGWVEQVIYSFCTQQDCLDGALPSAPLLEDASGNLYGTTDLGGDKLGGTVFELSLVAGTWSHSVLNNFCSGRKCRHGASPLSAVTVNPAGDLVGFAQAGGNHPGHEECDRIGCGVAYALSLSQLKPGYSLLHAFCAFTFCQDGGWPADWSAGASAPVLDSQGDIFGTASVGGAGRLCGTLFELTGSTLQVLYDFGKKKAAGCYPVGGLFRDSFGRLYGTAVAGGANGRGTIFQYVP